MTRKAGADIGASVRQGSQNGPLGWIERFERDRVAGFSAPVPIGGAQVLGRDPQAIAVPLLEDQGIAIPVDERDLDARAGRGRLLA
ncbi:MAG: hypothetical protein ACKO85_14675 [Isosphaeraceae bacterium]